ncbi:iron complex outermembrane recepter protein [Zunongwangia mangrovi]|uniref:Iron complex outermembrane recepter protein n=1 Tax=Zunongwangia mangrovi TaxID=1334022 RepID=A0A1I1N1L2_9FLAO|nr:TonB-dependent receptor [Zunongwangia mangrovi]SFC91226.1 iron complex outermembrane recepter protein [Zunongwangia mangrovi]
MKFFWIGLCLSLLTLNSFAQDSNFELSGTVTSQTGDALDGAYIKIGDQYFWTSEEGFYSAKLAEGTYQIEVSIIGFTSLDTVIQLQQDKRLDFVLVQSVNGLDEVMLEGHQHKKTSQQVLYVDNEYLQDQFSGSLASSLEKLPGFNAMQIGSGASKPIIRGLGLNRVAVAENGVKQEGQQWGADHGLEIDALQVEDLEIIKGVGSIAYGSDALGGVVRIKNNKVPEDGLSGSVYTFAKSVNNSLGGSAQIAYKKNDWFVKGKLTGLTFGDYNLPTDQISYLNFDIPIYDEQLKNTAGKELDWYTQIGVVKDRFSSTLSVSNVYQKSGFFPGSHGIPDVSRVQPDGDTRNIEEPFQRATHFKVISNSNFVFENGELDVDLSFQKNHRQEWSLFHTHYAGQQAPEINPNLELDFDLDTYGAKTTYHHDFDKRNETQIGLDAQWKNNEIQGFNFLLPEYHSANYAIFAIHEFEASKQNLWTLGLRFDYGKIDMEGYYDPNLYEFLIGNNQSEETATAYAQRSQDLNRDFTSFNARVGWDHRFNEQFSSKVNLGTAFRLPTAIELGANGIHHGSFRHEQGDPNLNPEQGFMADVSLNYAENSWNINLSPYAYFFSNYIFLRPSGTFSLLPHSGQLYSYTESEALLTGLELKIDKEIGRWHFGVAGEYLYNQQLTSSRSRNYPLPFTPANNVFTEVGYQLFTDSKVLKASEVNINNRSVMKQDRIAQGEDITPGYSLWGMGFQTKLKFDDFKANINFRIDNLFNTKYFNHTSFYRRLQIPEMGRNIQLSIKIPFGQS